MSTFKCPVIRVDKFGVNPHSETLCVFNGPQGPLQFKKGEIKPGDLACFIPADSMVPTDRPEFSFLKDKAGADGLARVRGIKLRKIPSVGLLLRCPDGFVLPDHDGAFGRALEPGDDLQHWYGVTKYEPPQTHSFGTSSLAASPPPGLSVSPQYDVENTWNFPEEVMGIEALWSISEKIHGCNWRAVMDESGEVHVGSRGRWVKEEGTNVWWRAYRKHESTLSKVLANNKGTILFGEVFGSVQDLHYGVEGVDLRLFDSYDTKAFKYNAVGDLCGMLMAVPDGISLMVPHVAFYRGTFGNAIEEAEKLCSGRSLIDNKTMREGVVVRPQIQEIVVPGVESIRLMTKVVSPEYLSRNGGTEEH